MAPILKDWDEDEIFFSSLQAMHVFDVDHPQLDLFFINNFSD